MINQIVLAAAAGLMAISSFLTGLVTPNEPVVEPTYTIIEHDPADFEVEPVPDIELGAALPGGQALFETALRERLDRTSTSSMKLISGTMRDGTALSGYHCFTVDEGRSDQEFICGTVSGTTVSDLERGISFNTGTTSSTTLQFAHRVGSNVKITDYPLIQRMRHILAGAEGAEDVMFYDASVSTSTIGADDRNIANVDYVNSVAFSGASVVSASETSRGVVEIATQAEIADSTQTGGSGTLVVPARYATSTAPSSGRYVPVTGTDGNLAEGFLPTTLAQNYTHNGTQAFNGAVTFSGTVSGISSSSVKVYTSNATWTKPSGLRHATIEVQAGGGGGAGVDTDESPGESGGGSAGGYCWEFLTAAELTSTETVTVGSGGSTGSNGGTPTQGTDGGSSSFGSHCTANGGLKGSFDEGTSVSGGTASGGDINVNGGSPTILSYSSDLTQYGGASYMCKFGVGFGCGGNGGIEGAITATAGRPGIVIVTEYF